ncbi:uncharacterized protein LOC108207470 [Daucus carota subsp. sativus]|nr:PREDICTED: tetratricopeptide repeat protein 4 homolog [Daucus carota subsp. sativus]
MALWLEPGSEPETQREADDLAAINAIKVSAAVELKEKGNEYVKMGKKHYSDAIDCYTRAINQKALSDAESSVLFSNRAHVNLQLGNYRRALLDAEQAIKLSPTYAKAYYRAVKASLSLKLLAEAESYCQKGLEQFPDNEELKKLFSQISLQKSENELREAQVSKALSAAKKLVSAIEDRGIKFGKAMFQELTGVKKPMIDKDNILHWPVLLLYAEVMSSDFIEDFCETDMFSAHLDMMFAEDSPPLPWDRENAYKREAIELYYEAASGVRLSKKDSLRYFLEGTVGSHIESFDDDEKHADEYSVNDVNSNGQGRSKWIKVNEKRTLYDVLREPNFLIPGIPVFYVVSAKSSFYKKFKAGKWAPPP